MFGTVPVANFANMRGDSDSILRHWPFFGGEENNGNTTTTTTQTQTDPAKPDPKPSEAAGGNSTVADDPIAKLQADPNALRDLLKQVTDLTTAHGEAKSQLDAIAQEKDKAERAQRSKEENLQKDLDNAHNQIQQLDEIVRSVVKQNAFITASGDIQWNSIKQAMAELDENAYDINVDLTNRMAEATGIDKEVERIAKAFPWLVKSAAQPDPNANQPKARPTGQPPASPKPGNGGKQAQRAAMANRFPILAQMG